MYKTDHSLNNGCLRITTNKIGQPIVVSVSLSCGIGQNLWAFLVDEGFFMVEDNNIELKFLVKKK